MVSPPTLTNTFVSNVFSSPQAQVATAGYCVLFIAVVSGIVMQARKDGDKMSVVQPILSILLVIVAYLLGIYTINCMVTGKCMIWAWVNSLIVILFAGLILLAILFGTTWPDPILLV